MLSQISFVLITSSTASFVAASLSETTFGGVNIDEFAQAPVSFKLRYFIDKGNWEAGGPILFYCGGWENIEVDTKNMVTPQLMAKELKAAVVFAEHRYYGKTLPYGADSFKNSTTLKYLQVEQVLADYKALAVFIRGYLMGEEAEGSKIRVPVIAVGGGYGGILASWLRAKYPDVIDGAWASSAPLSAFPSYSVGVGAFDHSVTEIYTGASYTHLNCNSTIDDFHTAFAALDAIGQTADGRAQLSKLFSLKPPLSSQADVALLKEFVRVTLIEMASANLPYASDVKVPLAPNPVEGVCLTMSAVSRVTDESKVDVVAATLLANVVRVYHNNTGQVSSYCVTPSACPPSHDELARRWQLCTQLPLWECSLGPPTDFFWPTCTKDTFESTRKAQCKEQFGGVFGWSDSMFQTDYVWNTTQAAWNGGKGIADIGNFIFTVSGVDPWWRSMIDFGIQHASKGIYYYLLEGVSANADLYQPMDCDPDNLVATRNQIANILKCWSGQMGDYDCKPDDLERVLPAYVKPENSGAICGKAQEPYSWEPQPNAQTTPKPKGASRSVASVLTFLSVAVAAVQ